MRRMAFVFLIAASILSASPALAADASFVVEAVNLLEKNYVDPLDRCELFNKAIGGLEFALMDADFLSELESIAPDDCPRAGVRFATEFEKAAEISKDMLSKTRLAFMAVDFMARSLKDSHVYFLPPERYHAVQNEQSGKVDEADIGVSLRQQKYDVYITEVFDGSPAKNLLLPFDIILTVNEQPVKGMDIFDVSDTILGDEDSWITVTVKRKDISEPLGFCLKRAKVAPPAVSAEMLERNIGYLKIRTFEREKVSDEVNSKINKLLDDDMKALILDIRGNSGGWLSEVKKIAGVFFPGNILFYRTKDNKTEAREMVDREPLQPYLSKYKFPVVLLVDGDSASASEILAAAMQEYGRATVVGEKTAVVVDGAHRLKMSGGAALMVTVKRVITPRGVRLGRVGVTPDHVVPFNPRGYLNAEDSQLLRALQVAKSKIKQ